MKNTLALVLMVFGIVSCNTSQNSMESIYQQRAYSEGMASWFKYQKDKNPNKVLIKKPQGGFYLMPEFINAKFQSSSEMCKNILNETGVALLPGSDFGFNKDRMLVRLSFTDFDGENLMKEYLLFQI